MQVLNSTSVLVEWGPVPADSRHGIITKYTIHYKDMEKKKEGTMVVQPPALNATVNGLRQKAGYSFKIQAATVKGSGPNSTARTVETERE